MAPAAAATPRTNAAARTPQRTPDFAAVACVIRCGGVLAEDVAEQAHPEREDAREVADDLDGNHQRRQNRHRPREVLEVMHDALRLEALIVVIEKGAYGQAERRIGIAGRRLQEKEK